MYKLIRVKRLTSDSRPESLCILTLLNISRFNISFARAFPVNRRTSGVKMPIPIAIRAVFDWRDIPRAATVIKTMPVFVLLYLVKLFFQGSRNRSERNMHGKVVMITVSVQMPRSLFNLTHKFPGRHIWHWSRGSERTGIARRTDPPSYTGSSQ